MPKIRPLPPQKVIKILERAGFRILRQKGSHLIMINERGTKIVVPVHPGKDIKPGLIRAIMKEAGLKREEFFKLLESKPRICSCRQEAVVKAGNICFVSETDKEHRFSLY